MLEHNFNLPPKHLKPSMIALFYRFVSGYRMVQALSSTEIAARALPEFQATFLIFHEFVKIFFYKIDY